jgi:fucose permease
MSHIEQIEKDDGMNNRRLIVLGNYFGFVVMGMIVISFGAIMPDIRSTFDLSYEQGGLMLSIFSLSYLASGLLGGVLSDKIGIKKTIILGNLLYVVGLLTIAASNNVWMLFLGIGITGIGWGYCNTAINVLINDISDGDGNAMSLLHMSFGIGAFVIPLIFSVFLRLDMTWQHMMVFLAVMASVALVLSTWMNIPQKTKSELKTKKDTGKKSWPMMLLFMGILFFYVGSENAFSGWMVTYLTTAVSFSESGAQNMLSTLWLMVIAGRIVTGRMSRSVPHSTMTFFMSLGALLAMLLFISTSSPFVIGLSIVIIGFMFSGIYPLTMANANPIIKGSATSSAIVIAGGGLGSTILPYVTGKIADEWGTTAIIYAIIVTLMAMVIFTGVNRFFVKKPTI